MKFLDVPFNRAAVVGDELRYVREAAESGHMAGDGEFGRQCESLLGSQLGSPVLLTTSCTHALELSALLLNLAEGDEVILPSFAFVSCANAFVLRGATPVFVDVVPGTCNIDPDAIEAAISPRTKAILLIHYAGAACDMTRIEAIAKEHGLDIIEDNAHALFGTYFGKQLGSFGRFGTLSFHETKNFQCGEGGAIVLNDPRDVERAEILREKGTNRAAFLRQTVSRYRWVDAGSSYGPSDLLAAFLFGQLSRRSAVQNRRAAFWHRYQRELSEPALRNGWVLPVTPQGAGHAHHIFFMVLPSRTERDACIAFLKERGIGASFHYQPLHRSPYARALGLEPRTLPVTEHAASGLLRLPLHYGMTDTDQDHVIESVQEFAKVRA